jgi:hypothetical protein
MKSKFFITILISILVACSPIVAQIPVKDEPMISPLSTQTFVSHQFHIVLDIPEEWQIVRSVRSNRVIAIGVEDFAIEEVYQGENGLLVIAALKDDVSISEACKIVARKSGRFGSEPTIKEISGQDQLGCTIQPSVDQPAEFSGQWAAIRSYPEPVELGLHLETHHHLVIIGYEPHIEAMAQSIRFEITPQEYLASTLDIIADTGMSFNADLNWDEVQEKAFTLADGAETTADTYLAIKYALTALETEHTFFFSPEEVAVGQNSVVDGSQAVSGKRLENGIGYVALQDIGGNLETLKDYANTLHHIIQDIDQEPTCGWIVSLRGNTGGSVFPMVAGLTPIIGEGEIGGFLLPNGQRRILSLDEGFVLVDGVVIPQFGELLNEHLYTLKEPLPPVAVLVDQQTASAAEITALAFIGRSNSRLFGEPTAGYTTGNEVFPMFDGAMMILTFAKELDRTGKVYFESIIPDEIVSSSEVMDAAIKWLLTHPMCISDQ